MATKTLSVDEEAYQILSKARRVPGESFSKVIKRASWGDGAPRCGALLARAVGEMSDAALDVLDKAQESDPPPESKWTR